MVEIISKLYEEKVEYNEFKPKLRNLLLESMNSIIVVNNNNNLECVILDKVNEDKIVDSEFYYKLILSEKIVKDLYDGKKLAWIPILYELELIFQKYLIYSGKCDINSIKIIKEMILKSSNNEWNCTDKLIDNSYIFKLITNKKVYYNLSLLFHKTNNKLTKKELDKAKEILNITNYEYCDENNLYLVNGDSKIIMIEDAFDSLIYYNPKWLDIFPQLQVEYYEDDNGYAIKSDYMELVDIYQNINDNDDKRYITYLLNKMKKDKIRILS